MENSDSIIAAAQQYNVIEIINKGLAYGIIVAGGLSVLFIFIGGISFILSGGQEEKIKKAVGTIRYAIIGLVITVLAVVIVSAIGRVLGLDVIKYINFTDIINTITNIGNQTSGGNSLD